MYLRDVKNVEMGKCLIRREIYVQNVRKINQLKETGSVKNVLKRPITIQKPCCAFYAELGAATTKHCKPVRQWLNRNAQFSPHTTRINKGVNVQLIDLILMELNVCLVIYRSSGVTKATSVKSVSKD